MPHVTGQIERHLRAMNFSPIHHAGTVNDVLVFRRCTQVGWMNTLFALHKSFKEDHNNETCCKHSDKWYIKTAAASRAHLFEVLLQVTLTGRGTGAAPACSRHQKLHICKQGIYSQHSSGSVLTETPTRKETALIPLGRLWEVSIDAKQGLTGHPRLKLADCLTRPHILCGVNKKCGRVQTAQETMTHCSCSVITFAM